MLSFHTQVFLTPQHLGIVMEYASKGDLYRLLQQTHGLREPDARWFFQQLMCALDYCHRKVGMLCMSSKLRMRSGFPGRG